MAEENIKQFIEEQGKETRRHFDVVADGLEHKIEQVAEGVSMNTEKIDAIQDTLNSHSQRFESIETSLEIIKLDIEFIKNELKQKVNRDEFAFLEKRVSMLEAKTR